MVLYQVHVRRLPRAERLPRGALHQLYPTTTTTTTATAAAAAAAAAAAGRLHWRHGRLECVLAALRRRHPNSQLHRERARLKQWQSVPC